MSKQSDTPKTESIQEILKIVAPMHTTFTVASAEGSYSNHTHIITIEFEDKPERKIIIRRYNKANGDCDVKALREFKALEFLQAYPVPVPKPLLLDETGKFLESPGMVTEFINGKLILASLAPQVWTNRITAVAKTLAQIHAVPYDNNTKQYLMNGNLEANWFLHQQKIPDYMRNYPDGTMVWETLNAKFADIQQCEHTFIHIDYWSGNILWNDNGVSAVVDWEEAGYGDPAIDVAYCRMELYLEGLDSAADEFLNAYEKVSGKRVTNLGFWELAASVRPMLNLDGWLTRPLMAERFQSFITNARERLNSEG